MITVSEADDQRDLNDDGFFDLDIVQWLDPSMGTLWTHDHGTSFSSYGAASWMGPSSDGTRLGVAYDELSNGVDLNNDGDQLDSVATFPAFTGSPRRLGFPGYAAAVQKTNAGIAFQNGWAFYRISEAEDDRDWNGDGVKDDFVMLRSRLADGLSQYIVELNSFPSPAVRPDLITGASGNQGGPAARRLLELGVPLRVAGTRLDALREAFPATEAVRLDLTDPATFAPALGGVGGVFLLRPPAIAKMGPTLNAFLDEAQRRGVRQRRRGRRRLGRLAHPGAGDGRRPLLGVEVTVAGPPSPGPLLTINHSERTHHP